MVIKIKMIKLRDYGILVITVLFKCARSPSLQSNWIQITHIYKRPIDVNHIYSCKHWVINKSYCTSQENKIYLNWLFKWFSRWACYLRKSAWRGVSVDYPNLFTQSSNITQFVSHRANIIRARGLRTSDCFQGEEMFIIIISCEIDVGYDNKLTNLRCTTTTEWSINIGGLGFSVTHQCYQHWSPQKQTGNKEKISSIWCSGRHPLKGAYHPGGRDLAN